MSVLSEYEVEEFLSKKRRKEGWYYLVKWAGYELQESTWEPYENIKECKDQLKKFEEKYSRDLKAKIA